MYLTREEERILNGDFGEAERLAMRVIVKVGDSLGAERLVRIVHAHVSGVSYNNIREAGLRFIEQLAEMGGKAKVFSTINPIGMDSHSWVSMGIDSKFAQKQLRIISALKRMGFTPSLTCTPYYIRPPRLGEHLAWGESSAVAYANTVFGARTNREGGPLALMAAIVGRTYYSGMHLDENRRPTIIIDAGKAGIRTSARAGLLGGYIGLTVKEGVPYVRGLQGMKEGLLKELCAAIGVFGSLAMCLIENVSPEANMYRGSLNGLEKVAVGREEIEWVRDKVSSGVDPEMLYIGCPHASLEELAELVRLLRGKGRVLKEFWVGVSRKTYLEALKSRLIDKIREHGIKVWSDTCPVVAPLGTLGYKTLGTNSVKTAFYMPLLHGIRTVVLDIDELVDYAYRG